MSTSIRDLDFKILLQLDDNSLVNYCVTDKKANDLCQDERFWEKLVISRFFYIDSKILNRYRGYRSWSNYYIRDLRKVNTAVGSDLEIYLIYGVINGRLDHVMIAIHNGADVESNDGYPIIGAIQIHNFEMFKYLVEHGATIDNGVFTVALRHKDFEIVKYIVEKGDIRGVNLQDIDMDLYLDPEPDDIVVIRPEAEIKENKNKISKYLQEIFGYNPVLHRHPDRED